MNPERLADLRERANDINGARGTSYDMMRVALAEALDAIERSGREAQSQIRAAQRAERERVALRVAELLYRPTPPHRQLPVAHIEWVLAKIRKMGDE